MGGALGGLQVEGFRKGALSRRHDDKDICLKQLDEKVTVVRDRFLPSLLFDVSSSSSE